MGSHVLVGSLRTFLWRWRALPRHTRIRLQSMLPEGSGACLADSPARRPHESLASDVFNCGHEYAKATSKPRVDRRDNQGAEHGHSYDDAHHTHDGAAAVLTLLSAVLIVTHDANSVLTAYDRLQTDTIRSRRKRLFRYRCKSARPPRTKCSFNLTNQYAGFTARMSHHV